MPWATSHHPTQVELDACVQCGLCLPVCPTFRLTGRETASPRGRIHAMAAVDQNIVEVDEGFASILDFCLGCRACEPVCPGLVPYGRMLEGSRAEIVAQVPDRATAGRWLVGSALGSRLLRRMSGWALILAQTLHLTGLAPGRFQSVVSGARDQTGRGKSVVGHTSLRSERGSIGLLAGCIQDEWFRPVNEVAVKLLERAGYGVSVPAKQTCCGALAAHDGHVDAAEALESQNRSALDGYDMVVATAAGCSAHLADYSWNGRVPETADITVVVARAIEAGYLPLLDPTGEKIAIQDPCHLRHAQRVVDEPRLILEAAGYEVVEVDPTAMCCGAAGMYTVHQPEASAKLGETKAREVVATGASKVASANPGCEMQLRFHLDAGFDIRHPVEWYAQAIGSGL